VEGRTGLGAAIQMTARLELDFPGLMVLSIGRSATSDANTLLELGGRWILYEVLLLFGEVRLALALMDGVKAPEPILRSPDTVEGWDVVGRLIRSVETNEVRSLRRPIQVGNPVLDDPRNCWMIS
jgi:hypothetical protein